MEELFFCPGCMAKLTSADGKCPVCGSELNIENAPHQLPVNCILNGRYLVGKVLGAGGFGITYIGYDLRLDGRVAIKEYYPSGAANRSVSLTVFPTNAAKNNPFDLGKSRFLTEAKTLSEFVEDGNIVTLRDYFEENGTAYIVMEYLEGEDLSHYAREHGLLEMDEALALLEPAMLALDKVHKKGLVHRDISPSNIMVLSDGRVKVLDFGSARLQNASGEQSLTVMLKHGYAPEEQYRPHGEQGPWTDVYAMSATIYKLITGKTPPAATERMFEDTLVPPSKLGAKLTAAQERALLHGLALRAPDRTQSMAELTASLRPKKKTPAVKIEKPKKEKPPKELKKKEKPPKPEKPPRPPKPPKPPKPVKEPKKKEKPEKPAASAEPAEKPAKPKKRPIIIAAALLTVLVLCVAVPKAKAAEAQKNLEEEQVLRLDELAAARDAIAGRGETTISAGRETTVGLKNDGTVLAVGNNENGQCDTSDWTDIVAVSAGGSHTVGLKPDGTVVAVGSNAYGQCDVSDWTDIIAVAAGGNHTVGIRLDGTVAAAGNKADGRCDVSDWTDIIAISASTSGTAGLKSDGTVVAVGSNSYGQCDVSDWTGIVAVSAGDFHTVGLKSDGTVVAVGSNRWGKCDTSDWTDIIAVSAGGLHTVGLKPDGTVVAVGDNGESYGGNYDVSGWTDIAAVSAGVGNIVGLKADGTAVAVGSGVEGRRDVSDWANIRLPEGVEATEPDEQQNPDALAAARAAIASHNETTVSAGDNFTIALCTDGTVLTAGSTYRDQRDTSAWSGIAAVSAGDSCVVGLKTDGTIIAAGDYSGQDGMLDWTDIAAVSTGYDHTVGLKADGTAVAAGNNRYGQCDVSGLSDIAAVSASFDHTVGLKADGTAVAVGERTPGQCDVDGWAFIMLPE